MSELKTYAAKYRDGTQEEIPCLKYQYNSEEHQHWFTRENGSFIVIPSSLIS